MVKNPEILEKFEKEYLSNDIRTIEEKFKRFNEMREYAFSLGVLSNENLLERLETKINVAKILNGIR